MDTTIELRRWSVGEEDGQPAHSLVEHIAACQKALAEIPEACRETASIDFDPAYEFGEYYASVRITYDRPMTQQEWKEFCDERKNHWNEQRSSAVDRIAYCDRQLADLA